MSLSGTDKALMYALAGRARCGATRSGYVNGRAYVTVAGVQVGDQIERGSMSVDDELNEVSNTCQFRAESLVAERGDEVIATIGSINRIERLFAGHVIRPKTMFLFDDRAAIGAEVNAVDYTQQLKGITVTAHYVGQSATAILFDLMTAAPGYSTAGIAVGLPVIDEITITDQPLDAAIGQVMGRIGGSWKIDYHRVLRALLDDDPNEPSPADLTLTHPTLTTFQDDEDDSQTVTRCFVEGRGTSILGAVTPGDTIVPLQAVDMFQAAGEFAKVSPQGSSGGAQHLAFTGSVPGGSGGFVGPGVTPSAAPSETVIAGAGVDAGQHGYGYTWVTGAGETKPSPIVSAITGVVPTPSVGPGHYADTSGWAQRYNVGDTLQYALSYASSFFIGPAAESALVLGAAYVVGTWSGAGSHAAVQHVTFDTPPVSSSGVAKYVRLWVSQNGGSFFLLQSNPIGPAAISWNIEDSYSALSLATTYPGASATAQQVSLGGIAVGPTGTTSRKIYRTLAGGSQLKLLATVANNTATTLTDSSADASLGANAPTSDTSGLTQPTGQVNPGDPSIITSGGAFQSTGGWAVIGNGQQCVRYTGITGNTLTGVPSSGPGAITAPITYNSTITPAPMLTGIPSSGPGSIREALVPGDELYLVVQVDDLAQQSVMAARYTTATYVDNGVRATWVQDRRLSIPEATARGRAVLDLSSQGIVGITYTVKDPQTKSGLNVTANMGTPVNVAGVFRIQRVTITDIATDVDDGDVAQPTYQAQASNQRFSLEDLIRQNRGLI